MSDATGDRFRRWAAEAAESADHGPHDAVPAATVIVVRDGDAGLEVLMLRRNSKLAFAGGMWVFPGGRVDPGDRVDAGVDDDRATSVLLEELAAARRAAAREAYEEAGLELDPSTFVTYSHWVPPPIAPKRFATWFFLAAAPPGGAIAVDGGEIHEHGWFRPVDALARRDAEEIELAPPTWVTLHELRHAERTTDALAFARAREPERFTTRIARLDADSGRGRSDASPEGGLVALWHGDAGYHDGDADRPGPRHRLVMVPGAWRYERSG